MNATKIVGLAGFVLAGFILLTQFNRPVLAESSAPSRAIVSEGGIRAAVLVYDETSRRLRESRPDQTFTSGERFRLRVRPERDGYLYIVGKSEDGAIRLLYPYSDSEEPVRKIRAGETQTFPRRDWYRFDEEPGVETMYVIVSRRKLQQFDRASLLEDGSLGQREFQTMGIERIPGDQDDREQEEDDRRRRNSSGRDVQVARLHLVHLP